MGQQQLFLTILVTVVVGIATYFSINLFYAQSDQAKMDAIKQDLASIATVAETWYMKPAALGGGNYVYGNLNFYNIPFPATVVNGSNGFIATNANATYWIRSSGARSYQVRAYPSHLEGYIPGATPGIGWFDMLYIFDEIRFSPDMDTLPSRLR